MLHIKRTVFLRLSLAVMLLGVNAPIVARSEPAESILKEMNIDLVKVVGGTFEMGDVFGENRKGNTLVHSVTLGAFFMSSTEITFAQYDRFCVAAGKDKPHDDGWGRGNRPVINVDWDEAVAFCAWLSKESGLEFRLPTEAEWEFAAREGGKKVRFGNGRGMGDPAEINFNGSAEFKKQYSRTGEDRQKTLPVGSFTPNSLGLHDMSGNVWEWCSDWFEKDYYRTGPAMNPQGGAPARYRVVRGGSWSGKPVSCTNRGMLTPESADLGNQVGFRIVRNK